MTEKGAKEMTIVVEDACIINNEIYTQFSNLDSDVTFIVKEHNAPVVSIRSDMIVMSVDHSANAYAGSFEGNDSKKLIGRFRFAPNCSRSFWNYYDLEGNLIKAGKTNRLQKFEFEVFEYLLMQGFFEQFKEITK